MAKSKSKEKKRRNTNGISKSDHLSSNSQYQNYKFGSMNKNDLLKSMRANNYIVLRDEFDRYYFITSSPHMIDNWDQSTTVQCHPMLSRKYPDPEDESQDERVYTFQDQGEKVNLYLHWFFGKKNRDSPNAYHVMGIVYDPYRFSKRVTGSATLWLPEGLPSV